MLDWKDGIGSNQVLCWWLHGHQVPRNQ